jgi:hypothetical protein
VIVCEGERERAMGCYPTGLGNCVTIRDMRSCGSGVV